MLVAAEQPVDSDRIERLEQLIMSLPRAGRSRATDQAIRAACNNRCAYCEHKRGRLVTEPLTVAHLVNQRDMRAQLWRQCQEDNYRWPTDDALFGRFVREHYNVMSNDIEMVIVLCENCHGLYDKTDKISFDEVRGIRHKIAVEAARSGIYLSYLCKQLVTTQRNFSMNNLYNVMSYLNDAQRTENVFATEFIIGYQAGRPGDSIGTYGWVAAVCAGALAI